MVENEIKSYCSEFRHVAMGTGEKHGKNGSNLRAVLHHVQRFRNLFKRRVARFEQAKLSGVCVQA